jgi:prephenate dehydratase
MQYDNNAAALRLKAVTEADPGALVRVLQFFQARNVVPRRVIARCLGVEFLEIEIELEAAQLPPEAFRIIVSKINELPIVMAAVVCD